MADMSVKLTLEVVDKATAHLKNMQAAMRSMNAAQATAGAKAEQNARKSAQVVKQATAAINTQAKAEKAASNAASEANAKRMAELQRRREAYRAFEREQRIAANEARAPHWADYWSNKQAMQAEAAAAKAASAQRKVTEAVKATGNEAAKTEGKLRRMARAVANAPWGAIGTAAGAAIGRAMGKAISENVRSRVAGALKGAWQSARGGMVGLMSNGRASMGAGLYSARTGVNQAGVNAMSNVQGAIDIENRLRPDLGSEEAARAQRQYADQWGRRAPFQTADTRAALTELAPAGIDPRGVMDMLGNTAAARADKGETMQSVARAWASVSRGDYSGLSAFGLTQQSDADGGSFVQAMVNGKMQKIMLDAEKSAETMGKLQQMISARMTGQMGHRAKSPEGLMIQMSNNWDAFTAKVMDAGPFAYVTDKLKEMLGYTDQLGEGGLDALATTMGTKIKNGLIEIENKLKSIWASLQQGLSVLDPVVNAFGGWGNVITMLIALPFVSYLSTLVIALGVVGSALMMAARAFIMLGAAMMATPLGWIVAGIAAIAAGAYLIYANWESVGPFFANLWETVKTAFANWKPLEAIKAAFDPVIQWVTGWGNTLYEAFAGAISKISAFVDGAWEKISKVWENVKGAVKGVGSWVGMGGGEAGGGAIAQAQAAQEGVKTLERLKALLAEVQSAVAAFSLLPALQASIGAAQSYLAGISFYSHGAAMMETLAQGMRAKAEAAVAAVRDVTQRIRDHLPHSPAKVGPLSDLHQIKFSETLAMGIHAGPAVAAVQNVVGQMRSAVTPVGISSVRGRGGAGGEGGMGNGGGGGATTIHYAPVVNGSGLDRQQLLDVLRQSAHDALAILDGQRANNDRLSFGGA